MISKSSFYAIIAGEKKYEMRLQIEPTIGKIESWIPTSGERGELFAYVKDDKRYVDLIFLPPRVSPP